MQLDEFSLAYCFYYSYKILSWHTKVLTSEIDETFAIKIWRITTEVID